jgi:hypothetical protein
MVDIIYLALTISSVAALVFLSATLVLPAF